METSFLRPKAAAKTLWRRLLSYFLKGLLLSVPLIITAVVIYKAFYFLDSLFPSDIPGLGLLILISSITLLGFLGTAIIQVPLLQKLEKALEKIPLIKLLYTSIRDLLSAVVGDKKFNKPVLVRMSKETGIYKLGFITQSNLEKLGMAEGKSAVYLPHSYNFSGNLFIVENHLIEPLPMSADEAMKFIVSGGITRV